MATPAAPLDDIMCERILQQGKYVDNTSYLTGGSKVLSIMCDKCFTTGIPASFHLDNYDICLLCAHKHKSRDIIYNLDSKCPEHTSKTTKKLQDIMTNFASKKINEEDVKFTRRLVYINFSMLRNLLPKAFWANLDQPCVDRYNEMLLRHADEFYYEFGPEFLAKVYKAEYEDRTTEIDDEPGVAIDPAESLVKTTLI